VPVGLQQEQHLVNRKIVVRASFERGRCSAHAPSAQEPAAPPKVPLVLSAGRNTADWNALHLL
jgi:hypothetical protein